MSKHPVPSSSRADAPPAPRWLWPLVGATLAVTLAMVLVVGLTAPDAASPVDDTDEEVARGGPAADEAPRARSRARATGRARMGSAAAADSGRWVAREPVEVAARPEDVAETTPLRLPGQLPPLHDPAKEAAARAERALQRDIERARDEAIAIGNQMANDLEQFVAEIQALPRAEQRSHARNVHAHFDWQSADRLAALRAKLPEDERNALQVVTYKRIEPLIWRLDALAAED